MNRNANPKPRRRVSLGPILRACALACPFLSIGWSALAETPKVVATIEPLHALVAGVMQGVATPTLLVPGGGSPHTYTLRPSDARALNDADLVFWIGEDLETFLKKPLQSLPKKAEIIEVSVLDGIRLLPAREAGIWEAHGRSGDGTARDDKDHDASSEVATPGHDQHGGASDMHLWLDPDNARVIVAAAAAALSALDPAHGPTYAENAERMKIEIDGADRAVAAKLAPVRDRPYVVFHDAYQYLEDHYRLAAAGSVTVSPDRPPGARRLHAIRERIREGGIVCVFAEPQFPPRLIATVVEDTPARTGILDPLGTEIPPGPGAYRALLLDLAEALFDCLSPAS
jgi:zinc transport system substrate-binding protein